MGVALRFEPQIAGLSLRSDTGPRILNYTAVRLCSLHEIDISLKSAT